MKYHKDMLRARGNAMHTEKGCAAKTGDLFDPTKGESKSV